MSGTTLQLDDANNAPRTVRFLDTWHLGPWTLKVYSIEKADRTVDEALIESARALTTTTLPAQPADHTPPVGFVGIHAGTYDVVFIDWWQAENELRNRVHHTKPGHTDWTDATATGAAYCIWDLRLAAFERDAWVDHVLRNPDGPDLGAYLDARYDGPA